MCRTQSFCKYKPSPRTSQLLHHLLRVWRPLERLLRSLWSLCEVPATHQAPLWTEVLPMQPAMPRPGRLKTQVKITLPIRCCPASSAVLSTVFLTCFLTCFALDNIQRLDATLEPGGRGGGHETGHHTSSLQYFPAQTPGLHHSSAYACTVLLDRHDGQTWASKHTIAWIHRLRP